MQLSSFLKWGESAQWGEVEAHGESRTRLRWDVFFLKGLLIHHMYMHVCVCVHMRICAGMDVCVRVCVHMCVCTSAGSCAGQRCLILWSWSYRSFKLPDSGTGH